MLRAKVTPGAKLMSFTVMNVLFMMYTVEQTTFNTYTRVTNAPRWEFN